MLKLEHISFSYPHQVVLDDLSLTIEDGQFIGIIGGNGVGKTTLLELFLGINRLQHGKVVNTFKNISFLSQITTTNDLFFPATVGELVSLGLKNKPFQFMRKDDWTKVENTLNLLGILNFKDKQLSELSGGEQQKVRLAKCLINEPDLLVLDEPTSGIDAESRKKFIDLLEEIHKSREITIILVTHLKEDLIFADTIYEIDEGTAKISERKDS